MTLWRLSTLGLVLAALTISAAPTFGDARVPGPPSLASRVVPLALPARARGATGIVLRHPRAAPAARSPVSAPSASRTSVYDFLVLVGVRRAPCGRALTSNPCAEDPAAEERGDCVILRSAGSGGRGPARLMG
jgi:hypothetical protein